jgi:hypothetical protein
MTIKIGIAASRADIVESELTARHFDFTKTENPDEYECYIFAIECTESYLPFLCLALFHAGFDAGQRHYQS